MAQQDKITTIDLIRAVLARNRAALAVVISLAAVVLGASLVLLVADRSSVTAVQTDLAAERAHMVTTIEAHAKQASTTLGRNYIAPEVLKAVSAVPRHEFVPDRLRGDAYADRPLPIGYGQTISQPFIVALMTDLARVGSDDAVLHSSWNRACFFRGGEMRLVSPLWLQGRNNKVQDGDLSANQQGRAAGAS